jgi:hypothetical protein
MFRKYLLLLVVLFGLLNSNDSLAASQKKGKHATSASKKSKSKAKNKRSSKTIVKATNKKVVVDTTKKELAKEPVKETNTKTTAPRQMIADNKEKSRIADSTRRASLVSINNKEEKEGYFASFFASQKKQLSSFQTLEGTAAVFKSISGWDDQKFYILTNQLPIGTIVRITTPELKSICAKVINSLPEVGNAVQYRLNDAAAAILGISSKTFKVSVTY